jgi:hypothetical protein
MASHLPPPQPYEFTVPPALCDVLPLPVLASVVPPLPCPPMRFACNGYCPDVVDGVAAVDLPVVPALVLPYALVRAVLADGAERSTPRMPW